MKFERRLKPQVLVDLTPLIDVVFQLVVFFMVSSVFNTSPGIELDLPTSTSSSSVSITELILTATEEGTVYLNQTPYSLDELPDAVAAFNFDPDDEGENVVLESDGEVPYQTVITILDILRKNGYEAVSLVTIEEP